MRRHEMGAGNSYSMTKNTRMFGRVVAAALAIAACGRTELSSIDAGDAGPPPDLELERDLPVDSSSVHADVAPDARDSTADTGPDTPVLGRDSGGPDAPITNQDTGLDAPNPPSRNLDAEMDGNSVPIDSLPIIDQGSSPDGGGPPACTAAPALGRLVLSAPTGVVLYSMALGELDGDGKLDIVTTNQDTSSVRVLLGQGDGRFVTRSDYSAGTYIYRIALGDLNGDGVLDIVAPANSPSTVSVLMGKGDGGFSAGVELAAEQRAQTVALGDLDGDGQLDIVVANSDADTVSEFLGNGDGTFLARQDFVSGKGPNRVAVADVNGDGKLDVITVNASAMTVSVLLGEGNGTLTAKRDFPTGSTHDYGRTAVAVGDVNGDHKLDLVVGNELDDGVSVLLGMGDGTFAAPVSLPTRKSPLAVALGDLNADGKLDLVVGDTSSVLSTRFGEGDGSFSERVDYPTVGVANEVVLGDVDGDGKLDIALLVSGSDVVKSFVAVLLGKGDSTFASRSAYPDGAGPTSVVLGDLDSDGKLDIVTANAGANSVSVFRGRGDGGFAGRVDYATGASPQSPVLGDVNGDGKPDLALVSGDKVSVLIGKGSGAFAAPTDSITGVGPRALALGDLDGDGKLDMVTANCAPEAEDGTVTSLLGHGDGTFTTKVEFAAGTNTKTVALGDLDGDGRLDLVVVNQGSRDGYEAMVRALLGKGDGSFSEYSWSTRTDGPNSVALADVNGDGKLDIVTANTSRPSVSVLLGDGDGTFAQAVDYLAGDGAQSVVVGDFDNDGKPDIIVANSGRGRSADVIAGPSSLGVLLGKGDGTFPSTTIDLTADWAALALGDLDGDGKLDLVGTNANTHSVDVLLRACR
jgi:hypothetical protein